MNSREIINHSLVATAIALAKETIVRAGEVESKGDLRSQTLRASVSVALNLAEGLGKGEVQSFFAIARGSLVETVAGMTIAGVPDLADKYHALCDDIDAWLSSRSEPSKGIESSPLSVINDGSSTESA